MLCVEEAGTLEIYIYIEGDTDEYSRTSYDRVRTWKKRNGPNVYKNGITVVAAGFQMNK